MSQQCSTNHDFPVTLHIPETYGQWSAFDHNSDTSSRRSSGEDMGLSVANLKSGD